MADERHRPRRTCCRSSVIDAENDAMATYHDRIDATEAADDPVTEALAVTLLVDEEVNRTAFRQESRSD